MIYADFLEEDGLHKTENAKRKAIKAKTTLPLIELEVGALLHG